MPDAPARLPSRRDRHASTRALACLAASLAVVNATLVLWPDADPTARSAPGALGDDRLVLELVEPTRQSGAAPTALPPPPAAPVPSAPPVEVPDDRTVAEPTVEVDLRPPPAPERSVPGPVAPAVPTGPATPGPPAPPLPPPPPPPPDPDRIVDVPDRQPRLRGQAPPVYPRSAARSGFRGRARVRVLVGADGRVTDAEIVERTVVEGGRESPATSFPAEFEAAVLEAARRHTFSPAREAGQAVRAYATLLLSLDPPT